MFRCFSCFQDHVDRLTLSEWCSAYSSTHPANGVGWQTPPTGGPLLHRGMSSCQVSCSIVKLFACCY